MNKKLAVLLVLLALVVSNTLIGQESIPQASAAANPAVVFSSPAVDCGNVVFNHGTLGTADFDLYVPTGYTVKEHIIDIWGTYWTELSGQSRHEYNIAWTGPYTRTGTMGYWIDIDGGYLYHSLELYAPSGLLVSASEISIGCPGGVTVHGGDIYAAPLPDPATRVMGTMLVDSPVYSEPNPNAALPDAVLTAGQTWFAVRQVTGTDGNKWYEVFVSGWHNGYVPASTMSLDGVLPEDEVAGAQEVETSGPIAPVAPPAGAKSSNAGGIKGGG